MNNTNNTVDCAFFEHEWTIYDNTTADGPGPYRICTRCKRVELWTGREYILAKLVVK